MVIKKRIVVWRENGQIHKKQHRATGYGSPDHELVEKKCQSDTQESRHEEPIDNRHPRKPLEKFCQRPAGSIQEKSGSGRPAIYPSFLCGSGKSQSNQLIDKGPKEN